MNKGEAARIAAKSKSGQVGIYMFKEPEKRKKKFSYKSRSQGFSVRKRATGENEAGANSRPATQLSQKTLKKPIVKNNDAVKTKQLKSHRNVNFVEKNIQKTKKPGASANTVTLTQEQLTKILQTLGGENTSLKFENGDIKIEEASDKQDHTVEKDVACNKSVIKHKEIADSLEQSSQSNENVSNSTEYRVANQNDSHKNQQGNQGGERTNTTEGVSENGGSVTTPRSNLGDIGGSVGITGFNDKDDAARRRRQWREELDKQVAEKQKEKERMKKVRLSGDGAEQWTPWGNLGDSGGRGQRKVDNTPPQVVQTQSVKSEMPINQNSKTEPPSSRMGHSYQQANTPAAMRSSFSFGNYSDESTSIKQKENKAWLQELEKQRQEDKDRQAKEKRRQLQAIKPEDDYWAKQVPAVKTSMTFQNMVTKDDTATEEKQEERGRSETVQSDPLSGTTVQQSTIITPRGHQRGQWALTDPAEVERQEKARVKHLEHIEAVKAQVEEKQRLKREAIEKRRREDKEEEDKLANERENLQKQFNMEAQKQKQKELDALAKHQALVESMQHAYEESMRLKQEKRLKHLNNNTSDVPTSLQHKEYEQVAASPRIGGNYGPVRRTPPSSTVAGGHMTQATDVRHSTVFEQAVQTDLSSVPEFTSPRLNERDKSAGIEYKEHKKKNAVNIDTDRCTNTSPRLNERDQSAGIEYKEHKKKNSVKIETNRCTKEDRKTPDNRENKEFEIKLRKKKKISERPKWGVKTEPKKKVKASDKDLTVSKKQREEQRRKRMQELLADQERNMPPPRTKKEGRKTGNQSPAFRVIHCADEEIDQVLKYNRGDQRSQRDQRDHHDQRDHRDQREQKRHTSQSNRNDRHREEEGIRKHRPEQFEDYSETPPLKTGDFVPFLRTDERLDVDSIPATPADYLGKHWDDNPEPPRKQYQHNQKDPLFSPDIRKDGEHRQKMILKQLSNLRQGLMMKQREMELGFISTMPLTT